MNDDRLNNSTLDEADRQVKQALLSVPVPISAKHRLLEKLHSEQNLQRVEDEQLLVQHDAVRQIAGQPELCSTVAITASAQAEEIATTEKAKSVIQNRKQTLAIMGCLAASVLAMISLFIAAQPYSQNRLVAECTQSLEMQPPNSWDNATSSSWTESLNLIRIAGIVRNPKQILHQSINKAVIGSQVRLWKLEFENQPTLYAVELLDAPNIRGVQPYLQHLNQANQSWSMATIRTDTSVFVFFTKGNLDQLMQVSPLA